MLTFLVTLRTIHFGECLDYVHIFEMSEAWHFTFGIQIDHAKSTRRLMILFVPKEPWGSHDSFLVVGWKELALTVNEIFNTDRRVVPPLRQPSFLQPSESLIAH